VTDESNIGRLTFIFLLLCVAMTCSAKQEVTIIPQPQSIQLGENIFELKRYFTIYADTQFVPEAKYLIKVLNKATEKQATIKLGLQKNSVVSLLKSDKNLGNEGYHLTVNDAGIVITATTNAGAFYGLQSLVQLLPAQVLAKGKADFPFYLPHIAIKDAPRFPWRAFMLDEARYFKGMTAVKTILDQMALHKMNVFHWHLTDDQGWRIEIKKYPRLTEVGAKRKDSQIAEWDSPMRSGHEHKGFYSQNEIREIIQYAKERHVTVVPEIGMPGHASAAIAAYPELSTSGKQIEVPVVFGKMPDSFNVADENVYRILTDILDEVIALFPSNVIHIGGDEVRFEQWQQSEEVKKMMLREGLKTMADVQIFFTNRMSQIIESRGRRMMGWNDIMGDDLHGFLKNGQTVKAASLSKNALIHFWKGSAKLAEKAIRKGHDVVNSWHSYTYLDYSYSFNGLAKIYSFDPVFKGLEPKYHSAIKGLGCQMWGEWIPNEQKMSKQIYPRFSACAEVGWTSLARKDYENFRRRMIVQQKRWDYQNIEYTKIYQNKLTAKDFFNYVKVGAWSSEQIQQSYQTIKWNVSEQVQAQGTFDVAMVFDKGLDATEIEWLALYEDGQEVVKDSHYGFSGHMLENISYKLKLDSFKKGAVYTLKASLKGSKGKDSSGEVRLVEVD